MGKDQKSMQETDMWGKHIFCKNISIYVINNISVLVNIIFIKFSYSLKIMSRNSFSDPQPNSASYSLLDISWSFIVFCMCVLSPKLEEAKYIDCLQNNGAVYSPEFFLVYLKIDNMIYVCKYTSDEVH